MTPLEFGKKLGLFALGKLGIDVMRMREEMLDYMVKTIREFCA